MCDRLGASHLPALYAPPSVRTADSAVGSSQTPVAITTSTHRGTCHRDASSSERTHRACLTLEPGRVCARRSKSVASCSESVLQKRLPMAVTQDMPQELPRCLRPGIPSHQVKL